MSQDKICTSFELKQFAFNEHNPTAFNFARWIESKTNKKFTVIEREFIIDALKALNKQAISLTMLNDEFKKKWQDIIRHL